MDSLNRKIRDFSIVFFSFFFFFDNFWRVFVNLFQDKRREKNMYSEKEKKRE